MKPLLHLLGHVDTEERDFYASGLEASRGLSNEPRVNFQDLEFDGTGMSEVIHISVSRRFSKWIDMFPLNMSCDGQSKEVRAIRSPLALPISQSEVLFDCALAYYSLHHTISTHFVY